MDGQTALQAIRDRALRGDYAAAAEVATALPRALRSRPAIVLDHARVRMRQGRMAIAEAVLATAELWQATSGERLVLGLEAAALHIYRRSDFAAALAAADAALAALRDVPMDPAERAEGERVHIRILLAAGAYFEVDAEAARQARDRLPAVASVLEAAVRIDEALAARATFAERLDTPLAIREALTELIGRAMAADRPAVAAEAQLSLARNALESGAASEIVRAALDAAARLFAAAGHVHGPVDVDCLRARLAIERERAGLDVLSACAETYRRLDFPRGLASVLIDLSQLAHQRGDVAGAVEYRQQALRLAEDTGLGLMRDNFQLALADLLMRNSNHGAAIELCEAVIASRPSRFFVASCEQLLASAYTFVKDAAQATAHAQRALDAFEALGADASASVAATKLAGDLMAAQQDAFWDQAEALLTRGIAKDDAQGRIADAVWKRELLADSALGRFLYSPTRRGEPGLLAAARAAIEEAEHGARQLPPREAAQRTGNLRQLRARIAQAGGDSAASEAALREALGIYENAGLDFEAANCRYLIGAIRLNLANEQLMPSFGESETNLKAALGYYEGALMRSQAADARFMIARLYANAAPRIDRKIGEQMVDAALAHLADGEAEYDAVRRDYAAGPAIEAQRGKRTFVAASRRIYELALEITAGYRFDAAAAWRWVQRGKARALADILGSGSAAPIRIMAALKGHPASLALVEREREIAARLDRTPPEHRPELRSALTQLRAQMADDPALREYLELRTGVAPDQQELGKVLADAGEARCLCVDWVVVGERIFLLGFRPNEEPRLEAVALDASFVAEFVGRHLAPESFRSTLHGNPSLLRRLDPLVAPIAQLAAAQDLVILAPTGPLHALPLHALEVAGTALIERNPCVYTPSLGVLHHCLTRGERHERLGSAAIFGDPSGDRPEAGKFVDELAARLGVEPLLGRQVTRDAFLRAAAGRRLVHFQGHARFDRAEPLNSRLAMSDGPLSAAEIFEGAGLGAGLVTLAACESAANDVAAGDEPLGLIPAFLYAGAGSVLATLWRVNQSSAVETMRSFYKSLIGGDDPIDKARALQRAVLNVRNDARYSAPYHWAAYVLYGSWR